MNALGILLIVVIIVYLTLYTNGYWKYFLGLIIPYYIFTQLIFADLKLNTPKKKFFICSWTHPFDSQIYASLKLDGSNLRSFLSSYNKEHKTQIGITTFFMKLIGNIFLKYPKLNGNVLFGLFLAKQRIDLSLMVTLDNGDTEIVTIKDVNTLSLDELNLKMKEKKDQINKRLDVNVNRRRFFSSILPTFLLSPFLRIMSYLSNCGVNLSWIGLPKYSIGTGIIANYGKIGLSETFLPIPQFTYAPICIGISQIKDKKTRDGKHKKVLKLFFTFDHRYLDGADAVKISRDVC